MSLILFLTPVGILRLQTKDTQRRQLPTFLYSTSLVRANIKLRTAAQRIKRYSRTIRWLLWQWSWVRSLEQAAHFFRRGRATLLDCRLSYCHQRLPVRTKCTTTSLGMWRLVCYYISTFTCSLVRNREQVNVLF